MRGKGLGMSKEGKESNDKAYQLKLQSHLETTYAFNTQLEVEPCNQGRQIHPASYGSKFQI